MPARTAPALSLKENGYRHHDGHQSQQHGAAHHPAQQVAALAVEVLIDGPLQSQVFPQVQAEVVALHDDKEHRPRVFGPLQWQRLAFYRHTVGQQRRDQHKRIQPTHYRPHQPMPTTDDASSLQVEYCHIDEHRGRHEQQQVPQHGLRDTHLPEAEEMLQQKLHGNQCRARSHQPAGTAKAGVDHRPPGYTCHQHHRQHHHCQHAANLHLTYRNHI